MLMKPWFIVLFIALFYLKIMFANTKKVAQTLSPVSTLEGHVIEVVHKYTCTNSLVTCLMTPSLYRHRQACKETQTQIGLFLSK